MNKNEKISAVLERMFGTLTFLPLPISLILWAFIELPSRTTFGIPLFEGPIGFFGFFGFLSLFDPNLPIMADLTPSLRLAGFLVYLPLAGLQTYWLWQLKGLFGCYAKGQIFTSENTAYIRRTAMAFLGIAFMSILVKTASILVLTLNNPPGQKLLSVSFGTPQISDILTGMILVVIAWIMDEGQKLKEEADYTV